MNRRRDQRGATLLELLIGATIVIFAITMASVAMISQNRALHSLDMTRITNESTRDSTLLLEETIRQLGWGIDPRYAIDFQHNCPALPAKCRDSATASDQLAFVARNPFYRWINFGDAGCATAGGCFTGNAWPISAIDIAPATSPKTVTVTLALGQVLEKGRIVLATCQGGQSGVMLTLSQRYTGTGNPQTLSPLPTNSAPYNDFNSLQTCHGQSGSGLFMVDQYRYFVSVQGGIPWLMLDPGIDLNNNSVLPPTDAADLLPVAKNLEDMQVAYVLTPSTTLLAPDSNTDWILGNDATLSTAEEPSLGAAAPIYTTPQTDAARFSLHPANVRGIRITLTTRSERVDTSHSPSWTGDILTGPENRAGTISGGRYRRSFSRTQVTLRNMAATGPFTY